MSEYENPILDIRAEVRSRAADRWQAEVRVAPGGNGGPPHRHRHQEERFRVVTAPLALIARRRGYRGHYPQYLAKPA